MGVQKDLEKARQDLEEVKKHLQKPDVKSAKDGLAKVKTALTNIGAQATAKHQKNQEGIVKLKQKLNAIRDAMKAMPFNGQKVMDAIDGAATAAASAATVAKSDS